MESKIEHDVRKWWSEEQIVVLKDVKGNITKYLKDGCCDFFLNWYFYVVKNILLS